MDLNPKDALVSAANSANLPVAFLVGSPLSKDSGGGVPGVAQMVDFVRDEIRTGAASKLADFENHISDCTGANAYQAAMAWLQGYLTQDAVNRVVARAVLQARKPAAPSEFDYDGTHSEWHLPQGTRQLAELVTRKQEHFPGPILTTNFDPLLSLAIEAAGGRPSLRVIDSDGDAGRGVERRPGGTEVVHLHGYWRDSDTLHTPAQLTGARPELKASLQRLLRQRTLVVAAYGGWDDVFAVALAEVLNDPDASVNVLWCFHESDGATVEVRYKQLLKLVERAIIRGRFLAYGGVDCHTIFAEIGGMATDSFVGASGSAPPLAGWHQIDSGYLTLLPPLRPEELPRYFDGAVPTLRHAVSDSIPRLQAVSEIARRLRTPRDQCTLQLIRAAGGEGKSTVLMQVAADAALHTDWGVLWRPSSDLGGLPHEHVANLDDARQWLIIADEAENLVRDLSESARRLHEAGRANVHFVMAARDADWRFARGDNPPWSEWLSREPDVVLRGITDNDAKLLVDAWQQCGAQGLRELATLSTRDERVAALRAAVRQAEYSRGEGSLFGGLLTVRFGQEGLHAHVRDFLNRLSEMRVVASDRTLFDAMLFISACHGVGIPGIDQNVLADLTGVPRDWVHRLVVRPLGDEAAAVQSAGHVFTRHSKVAAAILVEAEQSLGVDLAEVWTRLIRQTVSTSRNIQVSHQTHPRIVHAGPRLEQALPAQLSEDRRRLIAVAAAQASMAALPNRLDCIVDLGKTYRVANAGADAIRVFRENIVHAPYQVDFTEAIRGYWYEWSVCEGLQGDDREHAVANAWLAGLSLSDHLNPAPITGDRVGLSCSGLGLAFGKLARPQRDCVFAKARRAAVYLGRITSSDRRTIGYFDQHDREADEIDTPRPKDVSEAIAWLAIATAEAGNDCHDSFLANLARPPEISFASLRAYMGAK